MSSLGFEIDPMVKLGRLTTAQQQIVEIAKACSYESKILIMDEPTASLSKNEIDRLFSLMKTLQARGIGIVYISHRFEELRQVGDRISVLRDGRSIGTIPSHGFREDELIQMMVGRKIDDMYPRSHRPTDDVVLAVENLKLLPSARSVEPHRPPRRGRRHERAGRFRPDRAAEDHFRGAPAAFRPHHV